MDALLLFLCWTLWSRHQASSGCVHATACGSVRGRMPFFSWEAVRDASWRAIRTRAQWSAASG